MKPEGEQMLNKLVIICGRVTESKFWAKEKRNVVFKLQRK